eukprot:1498091-Rhodomonas_salina.1
MKVGSECWEMKVGSECWETTIVSECWEMKVGSECWEMKIDSECWGMKTTRSNTHTSHTLCLMMASSRRRCVQLIGVTLCQYTIRYARTDAPLHHTFLLLSPFGFRHWDSEVTLSAVGSRLFWCFPSSERTGDARGGGHTQLARREHTFIEHRH